MQLAVMLLMPAGCPWRVVPWKTINAVRRASSVVEDEVPIHGHWAAMRMLALYTAHATGPVDYPTSPRRWSPICQMQDVCGPVRGVGAVLCCDTGYQFTRRHLRGIALLERPRDRGKVMAISRHR